MVTSPIQGVLRVLRRTAMQDAVGVSDQELLQRFLATRDEAAFGALVQRYGPMVLGVCRRVLDHAQDAEDAFQATFLVLVRKASSVRQRATVGNWLYGVAYRTALKARAAAARRRVKEKHMARSEAYSEGVWLELRPLLDQELSAMPDKYREPLVLCDLQGSTRKEAARQLGWSEGTLSGRLARARELLAKRLARRGVALTGTAMAGVLTSSAASACVPARLVSSTIQAAAAVAAGSLIAGAVTAPVATLMEGVLKAMFLTKLKTVSVVLLAAGLLGLGVGVCLTHPSDAPAAQEPQGGAANQPAQAPTLPMGAPPSQILVSLKDSTLTVKFAYAQFKNAGLNRKMGGGAGGKIGGGGGGQGGGGGGGIGGAPGGAGGAPGLPGGGGGQGGGGQGGGGGGIGGAPGGIGGAPGLPGGGFGSVVAGGGYNGPMQTETFDLKEVQVFDTKGNPIEPNKLTKLLKDETVAMAFWGQEMNPLHLRVLKEGTLTFVLPARFGPGVMPPGGGFPKGNPGAPAITPPPLGGTGGAGAAPPGGGPGAGPVPPPSEKKPGQ